MFIQPIYLCLLKVEIHGIKTIILLASQEYHNSVK